MPDFRDAVDSLIALEGGFSNFDWDGGAATKYGITAATLGKHYGYDHPASVDEVKALDLVTARMIYSRLYWLPMHCGSLTWSLAFLLFDGAVNHGVRGATVLVQRALPPLVEDGLWGMRTNDAVMNSDPITLGVAFMKMRARKYIKLEDFPIAGRGWWNRTIDAAAIAWTGRITRLPDNSTANNPLTGKD